MEPFQGKKVTVVGFGRSGRAAAKLLLEAGARVKVSEVLPRERVTEDLARFSRKGVEFEFGGHQAKSLLEAEMIVVSPGVSLQVPALQEARARGIPIIGEVELASLFTSATLVGVTGSNGKSTTTALIGEMLRQAKRPVVVAGNIGTPLCDVVPELSPRHVVVVELSSFQLETIHSFRCHISLLLNLSPDHLDRYPDFSAYVRAKTRIFENQQSSDFAILNGDDPSCLSLFPQIQAHRLLFRRQGPVEEGCCLNGREILFRWKGQSTPICLSSEIGIQGVHNLENAMAACVAASLLGLEPEVLRKALREFSGLEHRLEDVLEKDGIRFVNDSKGTNVGATLKSLESYDAPILLIGGGRDKGSDFSPLAEVAKGRVKAFILMGEAKGKMKAALQGTAPILEAKDMGEAVRKAHSLAERGDVVLLSPACASFDMFANFEERGRAFKEEVRRLAQQAEALAG
ncbi:MAG: UDP-N-acetylmuramoyl-L-alanine--D-glutamate ligase [candidate division NC10 bacterium]|nr:UDP-N-acetylmuramoyl-L-alanine--D-glutamate ligase [candidate division NC10 bacterium]